MFSATRMAHSAAGGAVDVPQQCRHIVCCRPGAAAAAGAAQVLCRQAAGARVISAQRCAVLLQQLSGWSCSDPGMGVWGVLGSADTPTSTLCQATALLLAPSSCCGVPSHLVCLAMMLTLMQTRELCQCLDCPSGPCAMAAVWHTGWCSKRPYGMWCSGSILLEFRV